MPSSPRTPWITAALLLILSYGTLLRLDAFTGKYGSLDHPAWARLATHQVAALARSVRPSAIAWYREPRPYVGGDPINYLNYARQMRSFYQAHVREPVFLAATRLGLWALGGQDPAVSLASAAGSILAILATYLLGASLVSPAGGLIAAGLMAIEYDNVIWAVDGWRDDTFGAAFLFSAWALVRLCERASFGNALLVGLLGGAACLTRLTALSFILPALGWIVLSTRDREHLRAAALAMLILTAVVSPYLISCALAHGDPFYAVNYHTLYYRFAEGMPSQRPMSALGYVRAKLATHPMATLDGGAVGLLMWPFSQKWHGFDVWIAGLGRVLAWSSLAGMAMWLFSPRGRLMILMLVTSMAPFAFTWNVGGGGEWRFSMHVYGVYLIAAVQAWTTLLSPGWRSAIGRVGLRAAAVGAAAAIAASLYFALPWFVARESVANGEDTTISAGSRDRVFYRRGWSTPHTDGAITVRVSQAAQTTVHFPLAEKRAYEAVLRLDPVAPATQQRVTVLFNRQLIGTLHLSWDPQRVGSYRVPLPIAWVRTGDNEITLVPDSMVTAEAAGDRFDWIDPDTPIGLRVWYLRVLD